MARTYVVTGSASGIGAATVRRLEAEGARVVRVDLHDADVEVDLATIEGRQALVAGVAERTGGVVDAVVAGAGIMAFDPLTVRIDHFGAVATLEGLAPLLARGTHPRAVALSSQSLIGPVHPPTVEACLAGDEDAAVVAIAEQPVLAYQSSKRALARWVRRAAPTETWAGAGIPLNAIAPGVVRTPMTQPLLDTAEGRQLLDDAVPMPLAGAAEPDDVAALLVWLTSVENTHVTGQVIFIDGGSDVVLRGDDVF
jgi:NAD(P)-dependent dehydrogenase (short-subunit alcohol dehydrogenase family)